MAERAEITNGNATNGNTDTVEHVPALAKTYKNASDHETDELKVDIVRADPIQIDLPI